MRILLTVEVIYMFYSYVFGLYFVSLTSMTARHNYRCHQKARFCIKRFIVFQTVILQRTLNVTGSGAIRRRIYCRLDAWEVRQFGIMAEDTAHTYAQYLFAIRWEDYVEHWANIFHILVLRVRSAPLYREKGRVFQSGNICPKTCKPVLDLL